MKYFKPFIRDKIPLSPNCFLVKLFTSQPILYIFFAGYFRDISGSYTYSVLSGAGATLLASFIFTWAMIYQRRHGDDPRSRFNMEIDVQARRKSRRRSSILPWRKSVDLGFAL